LLETLQVRDGPEFEANENLIEVIINEKYPDQPVKIGTTSQAREQAKLIKLLRNNLDVFAWRVEDMQGISEEVAVHVLDIDPAQKGVIQKQRNFSSEKEEAIKEEVKKLLKAGIIEPIKYPKWLANVVMVKNLMESGGCV
jgi:hypothetical protein